MADGVIYKANGSRWARVETVKKGINNGGGWAETSIKHSSGSAWYRNYPMIQEVTKTWTNTASHTWSYQYNAWQDPDYDVLQGKYNTWGPYRGLWLFGSAVKDAVSGKNIKKIRVYVTRASTSGLAQAVPITIRPHTYASRPASNPTTMNESVVVYLSRNQGAWVDATSQFKTAFQNGTAYGIGIYTTNNTNAYYARMTSSAKIEITYDDYI